MKSTVIKGVNISALSLGTVQLGLSYGINNTDGKPSLETSFKILDSAVENGITSLDTASGYGDSEDVIGKWLKTKNPADHPFIATKMAGLDHSSLDALRRSVRENVESSKRRLGLEQLPLLMLHHSDEFFGDEDNVLKVMNELKESGDVKLIGTSAYSHHDYGKIADAGFDAVQIPLNIFDWKQIENGGVKKLHDAGMMVFVRSVYLQGLVFRDPDKLEPKMEFCRDTLVKFRALCSKYNLSPAALAISYASSLEGVTSLVLGCENVEQVKANIALFEEAVELTPAQMSEIREAFLNTDTKVVNPHLWPRDEE